MITEYIQERKAAFDAMAGQADAIEATGHRLVKTLQNGKTVLTCGNGGSAAEAQHLSSELVGRFKANRRSLPGICLNADTSVMTCISNDFGAETVYSRQLEGLGKPGDLLVVLTTSGNSRNIVHVLEKARSLNIESLALLGKDGGRCRGLASSEVIIPSNSTAVIQELHLCLIHYFCELVEAAFPA